MSPLQVAAQIVGQLGGAGIAARRLLAQRLEKDGIEIAAQRACEFLGCGAQLGGEVDGVFGGLGECVGVGVLAALSGVAVFGERRARGQRRPRRLADKNCARQGDRIRRGGRVGAATGEQAVEQRAECVDVGGGGRRLAAKLLGTGRLEREDARELGGLVQGQCVGAVGIDQLGDAEIQQLRFAFGGDQHVGGLDVAVHDEVAVGELHGVAELGDQPQPRRHRQAMLTAMLVDRLAIDIFHDEVGFALVAGAGVEQPRDARVLQIGLYLALGAEALLESGTCGAGQQLDRHLSAILRVIALGEVDPTHAAAAELAHDAVGPEPAALHGRLRCTGRLAKQAMRLTCNSHVDGAVTGVGSDELFELRAQFGIRACGLRDPGGALVLGLCERLLEQRFEALPSIGIERHGGAPSSPAYSSRVSQALAKRRSRLTVAAEMPSSCAISS